MIDNKFFVSLFDVFSLSNSVRIATKLLYKGVLYCQEIFVAVAIEYIVTWNLVWQSDQTHVGERWYSLNI